MDGEEVCVYGLRVVVEGCAGDDEDSRVDEEGEREEGDCEFDDGVGHACLDGGEGRAVLSHGVGTEGGVVGDVGRVWVLGLDVCIVKFSEAWLHDTGSEVETVWHDCCA